MESGNENGVNMAHYLKNKKKGRWRTEFHFILISDQFNCCDGHSPSVIVSVVAVYPDSNL